MLIPWKVTSNSPFSSRLFFDNCFWSQGSRNILLSGLGGGMWHASLNVMEEQGHLGIASDTITYNAIMKLCQPAWEHAFMALQEM